jgi:drug/metabolite transporter (DMT)-like permease
MISTGMMIALAIVYAAIVLAAIMERNWPRALYFIGAIVITVSILWMGDQHGNAT